MKKVQCRRDLRIVDRQFKALHVDAWKPGIARDGTIEQAKEVAGGCASGNLAFG